MLLYLHNKKLSISMKCVLFYNAVHVDSESQYTERVFIKGWHHQQGDSGSTPAEKKSIKPAIL